MECEYCGSHQVKSVVIEGIPVRECGLCGELIGSAKVVEDVTKILQARARKIDPKIAEYVQKLETITGFTAESCSYGDDFKNIPPYVSLHIAEEGMLFLEKIVFSLEHANLYCRERWVLEIAMKKGLVFEIKPAFSHLGRYVTPDMIHRAREDVETLLLTLERDMKLAWWYTKPDSSFDPSQPE